MSDIPLSVIARGLAGRQLDLGKLLDWANEKERLLPSEESRLLVLQNPRLPPGFWKEVVNWASAEYDVSAVHLLWNNAETEARRTGVSFDLRRDRLVSAPGSVAYSEAFRTLEGVGLKLDPISMQMLEALEGKDGKNPLDALEIFLRAYRGVQIPVLQDYLLHESPGDEVTVEESGLVTGTLSDSLIFRLDRDYLVAPHLFRGYSSGNSTPLRVQVREIDTNQSATLNVYEPAFKEERLSEVRSVLEDLVGMIK